MALFFRHLPDAVDEGERPAKIFELERFQQVVLFDYFPAVQLTQQLFYLGPAEGRDSAATRHAVAARKVFHHVHSGGKFPLCPKLILTERAAGENIKRVEGRAPEWHAGTLQTASQTDSLTRQALSF
jgi:hypothetical protein